MPMPNRARQSRADEAVRARRVVMKADFQRNQTRFAQIETLRDPALRPIPKVQPPAVLSSRDVLRVKAASVRVRRGPFAADHHVVLRLVPKIVVEFHPVGVILPTTGDVEILIQQQKAARRISLRVAQHRDHNFAAGEAVNGMRGAQVRFGFDVTRFDNFVDSRCASVGHVQDHDAAGTQSRHDEESPLLVSPRLLDEIAHLCPDLQRYRDQASPLDPRAVPVC